MKTLVEKSIKFRGIGKPETITIFNIDDETQKLSHLYKELTVLSGRKLTAQFETDNEGTKESHTLQLTFPKSDDAEAIKSFVLSEINNYLNK